MIIDNLPVLPSKPTTGDEIAIERGQSTYKVDYDNMVGNSLSAIESSIAIIVNGNTTSTTIAAGQYVYIKGSTILTEGLYIANSAVPSGTTVSSTYFAPVSGGGLNAIQQSMARIIGGLTGVIAIPPNTNFMSDVIPFGRTFARTPAIVANAVGYLYADEISHIIIVNPTTTGFQFRVKNLYSDTLNIQVSWMAYNYM